MTYSLLDSGCLDATQAFGLVGNGTTDDTAAVQRALARGAQLNRVVDFGAAVCRLTAGVTMTGPGLRFSMVPHGGSGGPGLKVTGTGYTALTVGPATLVSDFRACLYGTGNAAHGVYFNNILLSRVPQVRVYHLAGAHVKIDKCWDCLFGTISSELGGTATDYAVSFNDAGDTCNETTVQRLQVEQATQQALYVSPNSLGMRFTLIHSERLTPDASKVAWVFGGAGCSYGPTRLHSSTAGGRAQFIGDHTTWDALRAESNVDCQFTGSNGSQITLLSANIAGTAHEELNQTGKIVSVGSTFATWTGNTSNLHAV